jgi:hypothetical protein
VLTARIKNLLAGRLKRALNNYRLNKRINRIIPILPKIEKIVLFNKKGLVKDLNTELEDCTNQHLPPCSLF